MHQRVRDLLPGLVLVASLTLTAILYYPGLSGGWLVDDQQNIVDNTALHQPVTLDSAWAAAIAHKAGPLRRPLSMLSFWANYHAGAGLDPRPYKITNLVIHLINGLAAFWLLTGLFTACARKRLEFDARRVRWAAVAGTALWLVHPLDLTNILYVVQRMNSLSGGFTLLALATYVHGRNRLEESGRGWGWIASGLLVFTPLAILCKENGALAPVFMWVIEYFIFHFRSTQSAVSKTLVRMHAAVLLVPAAAALIFVGTHPDWLLASYRFRPFTLPERLLTETRVLWRYVGWIIAPTPARLGLAHDDIPISHALLDPPTTLLAILGWVTAIVVAFGSRKRAPLLGFSILWFLAGQLLESTIFGLEISFEHRTYISMLGPLAAFSFVMIGSSSARLPIARYTALFGFLAMLSFCTYVRATEWSDNRVMALYEVRHHPDSPRANVQAGITFAGLMTQKGADKDYDRDQAIYYLMRGAELSPTDPTSVFGLILVHGSTALGFDDDFVHWVVTRLEHRPIHPRVLDGFTTMMHWINKDYATIPTDVVKKVFQAVVSNPDLPPRIRAGIYAQMSGYFANHLHDRQTAVTLAIAAVKEDPSEPVYHLNLAQLAIILHRFDIAREQIDTARKTDPLGGTRPEQLRLRSQLETAEREDRVKAPAQASRPLSSKADPE